MKMAWLFVGVLVSLAITSGQVRTAEIKSATAKPGPNTAAVAKAAQDLATRLNASPLVETWLADEELHTRLQADIRMMGFLAALLAGELSNGKTVEQTRSIYQRLQDTGLRIMRNTRASGAMMPTADLDAYRDLMSKLQDYYAAPRQQKH